MPTDPGAMAIEDAPEGLPVTGERRTPIVVVHTL